MAELAELQARMAKALLTGRFEAVAGEIAPGPVGAAEALSVHRNTALFGLVQALRLTHPTVDALVGEAFFDQAALAFAAAAPPAGAWLAGYGAGFPAFLQTYGPAEGLPYLADVARLDAAVETAAGRAIGEAGPRLDLGPATLTLDASLMVLELGHPALDIREAVEAGEEALAALDPGPRPSSLALWRAEAGAAVRRISPLSAAFLEAALQGGDLDAVLACGGDPAVLQPEVFAAPFARLAVNP